MHELKRNSHCYMNKCLFRRVFSPVNVFQHLEQSDECRRSCSAKCFTLFDHATTKYQVKIKQRLVKLFSGKLHKRLGIFTSHVLLYFHFYCEHLAWPRLIAWRRASITLGEPVLYINHGKNELARIPNKLSTTGLHYNQQNVCKRSLYVPFESLAELSRNMISARKFVKRLITTSI